MDGVGRVLGAVCWWHANTQPHHRSGIVRRDVLVVTGDGFAVVQHAMLPATLSGWRLVAMGHLLGVVRLDRNADTHSSGHGDCGVWWQCVSDRLVGGQNLRRIVLRDELRTQRVVGMDCVLKDVWRRHALAITHGPETRIVRRHLRSAV